MTQTPAADQQFRSALEAVRQHDLESSQQPSFHLPTASVPAAKAGPGEVQGIEGDIWSTRDSYIRGSQAPADVLQAAMGRIEKHSTQLGAFEHVAHEEDLLAQLVKSEPSGPLYGIPFSIKDIIDVAGMPTTGSSVAVPPRHPVTEGVAVARLRAAGALIVGKTVTHEFALGVTTPQSFNPWDTSRVPGGSSGGSVISLVTGMALGSLGTDTRASIRVPAALSGAVGFRPTTGLVPIDGWMPLSWSMDVLAPMARSVRDIALLMDVLTDAGDFFRSSLPGSLDGIRIGVCVPLLADAEPAVAAAFDRAIAAIAEAGATIVRCELPSPYDIYLSNTAGMVMSRSEAAHAHMEAGTNLNLCIPEVQGQLSEAAGVLATDYVRCLRIRSELYERFGEAIKDVDVLVMPTSKAVAPLREEAERYLMLLSENCIPWSLVGFPAISVFSGLAEGLPTGLQLVAAPGCDASLLATAYAVERVLPPLPVWTS